MIKAVIFDIDNTLVDFLELKKSCIGPAVDAMIAKGLRMDKQQALNKIYELYSIRGMEYRRIFQDLLNEVGQFDYQLLAAAIIAYRNSRVIKPYPGIPELLQQIKERGIKMAIVSDAPNLKAWMRLTYMGIEGYFSAVVAFDDTHHTKPSHIPFEKAISELDVGSQDVLMVGDMPEKDIEGAKKMGFHTCFARYGNPYSEKGSSGAEHEAETPQDILRIIDEMNRAQ